MTRELADEIIVLGTMTTTAGGTNNVVADLEIRDLTKQILHNARGRMLFEQRYEYSRASSSLLSEMMSQLDDGCERGEWGGGTMAAHPRDDGTMKTDDDVLFVATLTTIVDGACFPPSHSLSSGGDGGGDAATNDTGMVELVSVGAAWRKADRVNAAIYAPSSFCIGGRGNDVGVVVAAPPLSRRHRRVVPHDARAILTLETNWDPWLAAASATAMGVRDTRANHPTYLIVAADLAGCNVGVDGALWWSLGRSIVASFSSTSSSSSPSSMSMLMSKSPPIGNESSSSSSFSCPGPSFGGVASTRAREDSDCSDPD